MKVTYNWLKDFVDIKTSPQVLAEKLTMAGLEVTSLEEKEGDFIFEIEVTSNRADCLSVVGIAREVAAITNSKLKLLSAKRYPLNAKDLQLRTYNLRLQIENKKDCPLYTAKIIKGAKVGSSPDWLKRRLELVGCRSVNNIVDITNYVMLEWGEPLHAFDLDKLSSKMIIVRRAKDNEKIITIDAEEKMLTGGILVIADKEEPVAIAGIMGGKDTEITEATKNILLEAAVFNPIVVRWARRFLGLESESAYRFERGVDLETVEFASWRAVELIQKLTGGRCVLAKTSGKAFTEAKIINLNVLIAHKILGINITPSKIKAILNSLGFKTKIRSKNNFKVEIPPYRSDVNLEIDLIEEIARIFGYESLPRSLPSMKPEMIFSEKQDLISSIKNILVGLGLNEVITYSFIDKDLLISFNLEEDYKAIEILNPLSKEQEILRPQLLPSLYACVAYNLNQKQDYINIFEIARVFLGTNTSPKEEIVLGIALCGSRSMLLEQGSIKDDVGFLHLKGILEVLFERLGIKDYSFNAMEKPFTFAVSINKEKAGLMTKLEENTQDKLNIKNKDIFALEISLDRIFSCAQLKKKFVALTKYPGIVRDISLILKENLSIKDVLLAMEEKGRPFLRKIKIIDYYRGKQIPPGFKGITLSCLYYSDERTLTEAEIDPLHSMLCNMLSEDFCAKIR